MLVNQMKKVHLVRQERNKRSSGCIMDGCSNNLRWEHFFLSDEAEKQTGLPVKIANDTKRAMLADKNSKI